MATTKILLGFGRQIYGTVEATPDGELTIEGDVKALEGVLKSARHAYGSDPRDQIEGLLKDRRNRSWAVPFEHSLFGTVGELQ